MTVITTRVWYLLIYLYFLISGNVDCSIDFFREILEPEIFSAHGLHLGETSLIGASALISGSAVASDAPVYYCGPLSELRSKMAEVSKLSPATADLSLVVYLKKSKQRGCFVSHLSTDIITAEKKKDSGSSWIVEYLPDVLKIHSSVLQYLSFITRKASPHDMELISKHKRRRSKSDIVKNVPALSMEDEINLAGIVMRTIPLGMLLKCHISCWLLRPSFTNIVVYCCMITKNISNVSLVIFIMLIVLSIAEGAVLTIEFLPTVTRTAIR